MRVLVCGSRSWTDRDRLYAVLDAFHANTDPIEVVIEGCQRGADRMAELWAAVRRIDDEHYPAVANLHADDHFEDVFPGSGAVGRAWEAWRTQLRLEVPA